MLTPSLRFTLAVAVLLLLHAAPSSAQVAKAYTLPPDLSARQTARAFDQYTRSLKALLHQAQLNDLRAWHQIQHDKAQGRDVSAAVASLKIAQQNVERQVDAMSAPFNVSDQASALFSAAYQAASDVASDYVNLAADFDIGGQMGDLSGLEQDVRETAQALHHDLATFHRAVAIGHRELTAG